MSAATQHTTALVSGFMDSIQEPQKPYISPARFAKAAGVSVQALAALAGVHRNYVGMLERGERNTSAKTLVALARALKTVPGALWSEFG